MITGKTAQIKPEMSKPSTSEGTITPMMAQYFEIKNGHPNSLLFYRMGDFYELFFEDATKASGVLDITLTHRGKHMGQKIPMCGVPVHASESYLNKLIKNGFRVAVCEQMETPEDARKRGTKSVVKRAVVRVVTPGTITEDGLLDSKENNYLAALADLRGNMALAWLDITTGSFQTCPVNIGSLMAELGRIEPGELLVSDHLLQNKSTRGKLENWEKSLVSLDKGQFDSEVAKKKLEKTFKIISLDILENFSQSEIAACGALIAYIEITQKGRLPHLQKPRRVLNDTVLGVDFATRRNLELTQTLSGENKGSLFSVMDHTTTGAGCRMLKSWLCSPLTSVCDIKKRQDGVQFFFDRADLRDELRKICKTVADIERPLSRLTLARGGPRDIASIRESLKAAQTLKDLLRTPAELSLPTLISSIINNLGGHQKLVDHLERAIITDPPLLVRDGGFFASGYSSELDKFLDLRDNSRKLIASLQTKYCDITNIPSLKIKNNNVLGYFVEVTPSNVQNILDNDKSPFIHRQTLVSAVRFGTIELTELETEIKNAAHQAHQLELALFESLLEEILKFADAIALTAQATAMIDVVLSLATLAEENKYVRPVIDDSLSFKISGGRHPVVEKMLNEKSAEGFIPNDCDLAEYSRLWLLTGPNMAGKSTFLRQNALITIMAQMGSFIPADTAHIGIVDRIFSRVGAADDLARGRSTFMVEMVETAAILNQANERSLVILDEIGRGTSTFDGLSIAWAALEQIHDNNKSRTLFATHYHELTCLETRLAGVHCYTVKVREWKGEVIFLHQIIAGSADRSYGIHVGRLAGLPAPVIIRAEEILEELQSKGYGKKAARLAEELPLFQSTYKPSKNEVSEMKLSAALEAIDPDELTPQAASEFVYELKSLLGEKQKNKKP
tara:strand:+ start:965 stop:3679 length:2715 start_codon:yes stop_codon:yes gene_type:complete